MEVLLVIGRFDVDGGVEMTVNQAYINIQKKCGLGGVDVSSELNGLMALEVFKELGEGVGSVGQKEEDIIDKPQPKTGLIKCRIKHVLLKEVHEQVSVGCCHAGAQGGKVVPLAWR